MKVAIINFSGNVGKTTVATHLLAPRLQAPQFAIETVNAGATDDTAAVERLKGREFGALQEELMVLERAIVDIGASNVEEFVKLMGQFAGSHEEFDAFVVPTVPGKKQQTDTVNTIKTLAGLGIPASKIRLLFNRVEVDDVAELDRPFALLYGFHAAQRSFVLNPAAVLLDNELFDRLRVLQRSVVDVLADTTDYRAALREAGNEAERSRAVSMISAQRLARSAQRNLDEAYTALFA